MPHTTLSGKSLTTRGGLATEHLPLFSSQSFLYVLFVLIVDGLNKYNAVISLKPSCRSGRQREVSVRPMDPGGWRPRVLEERAECLTVDLREILHWRERNYWSLYNKEVELFPGSRRRRSKQTKKGNMASHI